MSYEPKGYQRKYLRAPYKKEILFQDEDFIFKGSALNISEGGMLLKSLGHFPEHNQPIDFMICIPQFPFFKNFDLESLYRYNFEVLESRVIRFSAKIVRKIDIQNKVDDLFSSQIGLMIEDISPFDQAKISNYVDTFSSNLIYLQVLIDTINDNKKNISKIRLLSGYLGLDPHEKIAMLRKTVEHDYKSLQWL